MDDEGVSGEAPRQDQLMDEASHWFARMRGPDAEHFRPLFDEWLAEDATHLGAYNQAGEVFALGKFLSETPDFQTIADRNKPDAEYSWRPLAIAACALLFVGLGAWLNWGVIASRFGPGVTDTPQVVANDTGVRHFAADQGKHRDLTLEDGSKIALEAGSRLTARFTTKRRELMLERGQARFEVAHEQRPFVVKAGGGSVTARGTIFDVVIGRDNAVTVRLLRGAVDVERPAGNGAAGAVHPNITRLAPGETLSFGSSIIPTLVEDVIPTTGSVPSTSHASMGAIEFEKTPLSQVIARTNHGSALPIRLADPAIGALEVSGRFKIDDPAQVAERLAALFDLQVDRTRRDEIVLKAR